MKKIRIGLVFAILLGVFAGSSSSTKDQPEPISTPSLQDSVLTIEFIDVDEGNAALIICDGEAMLVDGDRFTDRQIDIQHLFYPSFG